MKTNSRITMLIIEMITIMVVKRNSGVLTGVKHLRQQPEVVKRNSGVLTGVKHLRQQPEVAETVAESLLEEKLSSECNIIHLFPFLILSLKINSFATFNCF
ncbi:unnamed protein product [Haemonchus placei]|uniref:Uncharacterized protein n=1 Tax=Haemonchus placei TaxID=6290 RepID=A0A3P8D064_HAEPC|nr:unnamed protein product [Haemonchus placei]